MAPTTSTPTRLQQPQARSQATPRAGATSPASSSASGAKSASRAAARDMLRDYYGLSKTGSTSNDAKTGSTTSSNATSTDPLNLDSPSFSSQAYMQNLLNTATLSQLLKASTELSTSITDLENERQNLVYNHHHELIDASVTISKMKIRAESLDTTLEQLKAGLSKCSELNDGLRLPISLRNHASTIAPHEDNHDPNASLAEPSEATALANHSKDSIATQTKTVTTSSNIDWQSVLGTIVDLPATMRNASPEEAQRLWGTYEPVLRTWKDAGVEGVQDIESECRHALNGS